MLEKYCNNALDMGVDDVLVISPERVFTAPWVRIKCQYGCAMYGRRRSCPPYSSTPDETRRILNSYRKALLLRKHWIKSYMVVDDFNQVVVSLERMIFLDNYYKAFGMGSGPCNLCKTCNMEEPCVNALDSRPSMEACGIDVYKTVLENGLPIEVVQNHSQERNIYGLILVE
jgi:predicted metal-binding protein